MDNANYQEAVEILEKRFGNKQQIITKHMEILMAVEPVASNSNTKSLRHLYDTVEAQVRGLKALGVASESYGCLLSSTLMTKLPPEVRLIVSREVGENNWELDKLLKTLEKELCARERVAVGVPAPHKRPPSIPPTGAALMSGINNTKPFCCYCQQPHHSSSCRTVTSTEERKRLLRESGRCYVCLKRGHISRKCRSTTSCSTCQGRHHVSICSKSATPTEPTPQPKSRDGVAGDSHRHVTFKEPEPPRKLNPTTPPFEPTANLWTCADQTVLLQTAQAVVFNPENTGHIKRIRIVFDSGSQRSYINERLRKELLLRKRGEQSMSIATFGSRKLCNRVCEVVEVAVKKSNGGMILVPLFTVPLICEPITCQPIAFCQDKFEHLASLSLADSSEDQTQLKIDVLIGSDQYWNFVTGQIKRGDSGPVGIQTELGWVLSGPTQSESYDSIETSLVVHTLCVNGNPSPNLQALDNTLKLFWDLESLGIAFEPTSVLDEFQGKIRFVGDRYEVSLPWKNPQNALPDNYKLSLKRMWALLHRLRQTPEILSEYDAIIQSQLQQGIIECVKLQEKTIYRTTQ